MLGTVAENMGIAKQMAFEGWSTVIEREVGLDQLTLYEEYATIINGSVSALEEEEIADKSDLVIPGREVPWVTLAGCVEE